MIQIYEEILRLQREGKPSALATIVQCRGSSPQKEGAKMLIRGDGSTLGTLGGGCLEADVIQAARMAMKDGTPLSLPFELTEKHGGLICGGKVLVYIEPHHPEPHLVVLGAGHVGKAVCKLARFAGFRVTVVDPREEYANAEAIPMAHEVVVHDFETVFSTVAAGPSTYVLVATRGHNHDLAAVQAALRTEAQYIGLLGSRRKRALLFKALEAQGFGPQDLDRVIIPVGLAIGSVTPEEIALSIMAQIIEKRRAHARPSDGHTTCGGLVDEDGSAEAAASPEWKTADPPVSRGDA